MLHLNTVFIAVSDAITIRNSCYRTKLCNRTL